MKVIGCYTEKQVWEELAKYENIPKESLPADLVKEPETVYRICISDEDGIEKSVLILKPGAEILEHGHPARVQETYSTRQFKNRNYMTKVLISETCKTGQRHNLINDSDYWAIVQSTKRKK